jgi:SAM-dependent methyltransferase
VRTDSIATLACPHDGATPLELHTASGDADAIQSGELCCPTCGSKFPITQGIPRFLVLSEDETSAIKRQEIAARDRASRKRTSWELPVERFAEVDALAAAVGDCRGHRTLDAGCGVGLATSVLSTAAQILALDFSWEGLMKFYFPYSTPLELIQGDVCRLPFADGVFDLALSSQVLEHVPSAAARETFIAALARVLKPNGRLVLTVYNWDVGRQQSGIAKEGFHANGIFYRCFDAAELERTLAPHFAIDAIWGLQVTLPLTFRLMTRLGRRTVSWDRLWRRGAIGRRYGKLLLAIARRST